MLLDPWWIRWNVVVADTCKPCFKGLMVGLFLACQMLDNLLPQAWILHKMLIPNLLTVMLTALLLGLDTCRTWHVTPVVDCLLATQSLTTCHDIDVLILLVDVDMYVFTIVVLKTELSTMRDICACCFWDLHHNSIGHVKFPRGSRPKVY